MTPSAYSIGITGTGRVAQALGRLLNESGQQIVAIAGRDSERTARAARFISTRTTPTTIEAIPAFASHLLIAISDSAVEHVPSLLARSGLERGIALHTCGAKGPQALAVLARQGISCGALHPMQSFASAEQGLTALRKSSFAIDGDPEAREWCSFIATLVSGRTLRIRAEDRSLYHPAAVMASNYISALIYGALEMLEAAGVERSMALRTGATGQNMYRELSPPWASRGSDRPH